MATTNTTGTTTVIYYKLTTTSDYNNWRTNEQLVITIAMTVKMDEWIDALMNYWMTIPSKPDE